MKRTNAERALAALLLLLCAATSFAQTKRRTTMHAKGTFEVKMGQADTPEIGKAAGLGTMTIDKTWSGDITGTSKGVMTHGAADKAMAYVALEKMDVAVNGHAGTFLFTHRATMMSDDPTTAVLEVTVVPNSGTGALTGIAGTLKITIDKSGHSYDFEYTLP
jgi:hypothetical protein